MDKERLKNLARNKEFIAGIYNYCDRWCERCPFTARCMNFAISIEDFPSDESSDMSNEAFWQKLSETLKATLGLLKDAAEERGFDLSECDPGTMEEKDLKDEAARNSKWCRAAKAYAEMVNEWFNSRSYFLERDSPEEYTNIRPDYEGAISLHDAVEVIRWYQHFIYVKLIRAIRGKEDESEDGDCYAKDSDGSAKLVLIALDRSIAAWNEVLQAFPSQNTSSTDPIIHLNQMRRGIEELFPDARAFIRPGFDRIDLNS